MKELVLYIDEDCQLCAKGLVRLAEYQRRHSRHYGRMSLDTGKPLPGVVFTPDYNANGVLTHWHIENDGK